jgi:alpha-D-ribose 1-methylphosphonate 5-triphosphate synthase subunit PhnH
MRRTALQEQTLYNAVTFRHLLDCLARPGKIKQLEYPHFIGEAPYYHVQATATAMSVNLYALSAMLTLLDREVTFAVAADGRWLSHTSPIVQWLLLRSGSTLTAPESALFAFFCQGRSDGLITQLSRGTQLEPESSATAFYCVEQLVEETDRLEENLDWMTLELTGPGVQSMQRVSVIGLDRNEIESINLARRGYPLGVDIYLMDALGRCVGLPRTTRIQMIEKEGYNGLCRS